MTENEKELKRIIELEIARLGSSEAALNLYSLIESPKDKESTKKIIVDIITKYVHNNI